LSHEIMLVHRVEVKCLFESFRQPWVQRVEAMVAIRPFGPNFEGVLLKG
jgi:hypothetical protein